MTHESFVAQYPPRPPARAALNPDEERKLCAADGLLFLGAAPASNTGGAQPSKQGDPECQLWVFDRAGIPYIAEKARIAPPLQSGIVKHTNLTGGETASCGGEFWFDTPEATTLYINGCSGRYGPRTAQQLADAVSVFQDLGYAVISFGWDQELNLPAKVLR
jgi:hypothetical protein